ncbi:MAG TPA: hypothetical protein VK166_00870 [Chitinophagaceae bacterium]|nr:hypothetical protein [Chitinophagaceae bacterium]
MKYTFLLSILIVLLAAIFYSCSKEKSPEVVKTWNWEYMGRPYGDSTVQSIYVHSQDDKLWFISSFRGLYITRDGGKSWEKPLIGINPAIEFDPVNSSIIYSSSGNSIYVSEDRGRTWTNLYTFPRYVVSILVSKVDHSILVGVAWSDMQMANGIFKSSDKGRTWSYYSYNVSAMGLIPWDIEEDAVNNKLYVSTEIWDHPKPYKPPFLRSSDGGLTWTNVGDSIPWHVIRIQIQPGSNDVYALTEGVGIYYSKDFGTHWQRLSSPFWLTLTIDKNHPNVFYGGTHTYANSGGGIYLSKDAGKTYEGSPRSRPIGLENKIVSSICLNSTSTIVYAAAYNSGIYMSRIP